MFLTLPIKYKEECNHCLQSLSQTPFPLHLAQSQSGSTFWGWIRLFAIFIAAYAASAEGARAWHDNCFSFHSCCLTYWMLLFLSELRFWHQTLSISEFSCFLRRYVPCLCSPSHHQILPLIQGFIPSRCDYFNTLIARLTTCTCSKRKLTCIFQLI